MNLTILKKVKHKNSFHILTLKVHEKRPIPNWSKWYSTTRKVFKYLHSDEYFDYRKVYELVTVKGKGNVCDCDAWLIFVCMCASVDESVWESWKGVKINNK